METQTTNATNDNVNTGKQAIRTKTSRATIYAKLLNVQQGLKAPKGQRNTFGNYSYRSCEDVLEAVKPLLNDNGLVLVLNDEIEVKHDDMHGVGRVYVRATATLYCAETGACIENCAYAREELTKKGMDASQITGSASSYARKYALNGLFAIDDNKDADATNTHAPVEKATKKQVERIRELGADEAKLCKRFNVKSIEELNAEDAKWAIAVKEGAK